MYDFYEHIDDEIFGSITKKLIESVTTDALITYMEQYRELTKVSHETYDKICEMLASGEIRLVDSAWKSEPESYLSYPKKPGFINVENYKKINELRKDKRDWEKNWREYDDKYPIRASYDNKAEFWMGEYFSRNLHMHINSAMISELKVEKFQFMLEVLRNNDSWYSSNYGQEYIFEFTGEDSKTKFVEFFRERICKDMAKKLMAKRREQLIEEESNKAIEFCHTLF